MMQTVSSAVVLLSGLVYIFVLSSRSGQRSSALHLDYSSPTGNKNIPTPLGVGIFLVPVAGLVYIFAFGEDRGSPRSSPRRQQSAGLLHLDYSSPSHNIKISRYPDGVSAYLSAYRFVNTLHLFER